MVNSFHFILVTVGEGSHKWISLAEASYQLNPAPSLSHQNIQPGFAGQNHNNSNAEASSVASPKIWERSKNFGGAKMLDFRQITPF